MTAIEFFDRTHIDNIISSLTVAPDKIIFIGDGKLMKKFGDSYRYFIENREMDIEIDYKCINKNNLEGIVKVLSEIVESEEDCVFDLTGGYDLVLVAMGVVFERYRDKNIQMQRFNINSGLVTDCDKDGKVIHTGSPALLVEELISIHGGRVRCGNENGEKIYNRNLNREFKEDINRMWDICRSNPKNWNSRISSLATVNSLVEGGDLAMCIDIATLKDRLKNDGVKYAAVKSFLKVLDREELIFNYSTNGKEISFVYKNKEVKKCLSKAGNILELKVLSSAEGLREKDGTPYYSDSLSGVFIDWDGEFHTSSDEEKDTYNEIDVILVKGTTPIFVSCKNGQVDENELYKLDSVTSRFGGIYAKKVLITTYIGKKPQGLAHFRQRAEDMNIELIEEAHKLECFR